MLEAGLAGDADELARDPVGDGLRVRLLGQRQRPLEEVTELGVVGELGGVVGSQAELGRVAVAALAR